MLQLNNQSFSSQNDTHIFLSQDDPISLLSPNIIFIIHSQIDRIIGKDCSSFPAFP